MPFLEHKKLGYPYLKIEKLQEKIAEKHGYRLVDHKLELYGIKKKT